jgi:carbonic anhydrase
MTTRSLVSLIKCIAWTAVLAWTLELSPLGLASDHGSAVKPDQASRLLAEGNARYVAGKSVHPRDDSSRRHETAAHGQHPLATVIACSDSRAPVEIVFDQGVGDVFVIRVAGNVCRVDEIGSTEYAVDHLGTPLVVVLGHTHCGAVTAAATGAELHGSVAPLVHSIDPAVATAQKQHPDLHGADLVPAAVEANVWQSIANLCKQSTIVRQQVKSGKLKVVGAIYDLESGRVKWLGEHAKALQKQ